MSRNPPRPIFIKASVKVQHQCPWCGFDDREGTHGMQEDRPNGDGVNILCKILVQVMHPARVFVMEGTTV